MFTVTYSPEDNRIRLYVGRVSREDYDALRAAGFVATPKQDCDFVATWTPKREDIAREFLAEGEDIGDEGYSATERAADRAERFDDYHDRRAAEATGAADAYDAGPQAFGHQNRARAERQAKRHDRTRTYAVGQWGKAEYWARRTAGVIAHALHRADPATRRGRIKTLEAEQRKHEKERAEYAARYAGWAKVPTLEGADRPGVHVCEGSRMGFTPESVTPALRAAYALANYGGLRSNFTHPRTGETGRSMYDLLTHATDPLSPAECAALWLANSTDPADPDTHAARWSAHYENRLAYERAMLANEGGTAADADMEPGGFVGGYQIHAVNKSPVTGKVVSVRLAKGGAAPKLFNVERLPEGVYRAPTDAERTEFAERTAAAKAEKKAAAPKAPPLVNPTDEDAERLQAHWNAKAAARFAQWKREGGYGEFVPTTVKRMTQAEYSAKSAVAHGTCETTEVMTNGHRVPGYMDYKTPRLPVAAKVRTTYGRTGWTGAALAVIVIADKPQKALPLDWANLDAPAEVATAEAVTA